MPEPALGGTKGEVCVMRLRLGQVQDIGRAGYGMMGACAFTLLPTTPVTTSGCTSSST